MTLCGLLAAQGNFKRRGMAHWANALPFSISLHSSERRLLFRPIIAIFYYGLLVT